jgi:hypothetical protein
MLADWAEQSKLADRLLPLPREFDKHRLAAYREEANCTTTNGLAARGAK